ncbi:hypothetical protein [Nocardioides sp. BYT-33-1]|uniref:hypothetical protein n=1 Tax=Nocardioides sp. BYT-33-1 TaxID=3416952 RepID=UPI003F53738F
MSNEKHENDQQIYRSRWLACDDCECVLIVERDDDRGVPDEQEWDEFPDCPVCGGFLGSNWNADEQTARETALRQGDRRAAGVQRLYSDQREVLDNLAQSLHDWHGVISRSQFLGAFDGVEDLIPESLREVSA